MGTGRFLLASVVVVLAVACAGKSTPPLVAVEPAQTVEIEETIEPEPPLPRRLGPPSSWRILAGSEAQPLATRIAMRDALGCGIWQLDGVFLGPTDDEECEHNPALREPPWDLRAITVGDETRTLWSARIEGNRFEAPNLRGSTKRGRYRALDFGIQVTTDDDEYLDNGLALLVEYEQGELALELWSLGAGERIAKHELPRGDASGQGYALVGAWVEWSEIALAVVLDLRAGSVRRIRWLAWPDRHAAPLVREFPTAGESATVVDVRTDGALLVVELEREGVRDIQVVSLAHFELEPIVVPVDCRCCGTANEQEPARSRCASAHPHRRSDRDAASEPLALRLRIKRDRFGDRVGALRGDVEGQRALVVNDGSRLLVDADPRVPVGVVGSQPGHLVVDPGGERADRVAGVVEGDHDHIAAADRHVDTIDLVGEIGRSDLGR